MPPFFITVISLGVACAIGAGVAWRIQSATIAEMRLEHAETRIAAGRVARAAIERATTTVITAQNNAASRGPVLRAAADASRSELDRLRESTTNAMRAASGSLDACAANSVATSQLLNQCGAELQALAGRADGHVSDITTLTEAWPK